MKTYGRMNVAANQLTFVSESKWILKIQPDGTVEFSDHLSPEESAKEAWNILMEHAATYNDNIRNYLRFQERTGKGKL